MTRICQEIFVFKRQSSNVSQTPANRFWETEPLRAQFKLAKPGDSSSPHLSGFPEAPGTNNNVASRPARYRNGRGDVSAPPRSLWSITRNVVSPQCLIKGPDKGILAAGETVRRVFADDASLWQSSRRWWNYSTSTGFIDVPLIPRRKLQIIIQRWERAYVVIQGF